MPTFKMGQWNSVCDKCGLEFKSSELIKDWQGLMVDAKCYEQRHPQDLIKIKPEKAIPEWVRPRPQDVYVGICDLWTEAPLAGYGTAGCMTVGAFSNIETLINVFSVPSIAGIAIPGLSIPGAF